MIQNRDIPHDWEWVTVAEVTRQVEKVQPKNKPEEPFTYIDISSIDNSLHKITVPKNYLGKEAPSRARQLIRKDDVLFSTVRTYLENIAFVPELYDGQVASTGFSVLRANESLDPKFLFYYCLTQEFLEPLNNLQRGTSYPAVRDGDVRSQSFPLPPLGKQKNIVSKIEELFSQLDAGVAGLKRAKAGLKRYRASVLKAAFEGRLVPQDPKDELDYRFINDISKNQNYGDNYSNLPENWSVAKIGDITDLVTKGSTPTTYGFSYQEQGIRFIKAQNINKDGTINHNTDYISKEAHEFQKRSVLEENDILFSIAGTIGRVGIVKKEDLPANTNQALAIIRGFSPEVNIRYLFHLLSSSFIQKQATSSKVGVGRSNISLGDIKEFILPLPPYTEQLKIVNEVEKYQSIIDELEESVASQINLSVVLKNSILNSAFEGKL